MSGSQGTLRLVSALGLLSLASCGAQAPPEAGAADAVPAGGASEAAAAGACATSSCEEPAAARLSPTEIARSDGGPSDAPGNTLPPRSGGAAETPEGPRAPGECDRLRGAAIARQVGFPGAGMQIDLRLVVSDGPPQTGEDLSHRVTLRDVTTGEALPAATATHAAEADFTLLLIAAGDTDTESDAARAAAESLTALRPADEAIALFRWAEDVVQLNTFQTDRQRLRAQLARLGNRGAAPLSADEALRAVHDDIAKVGGDSAAALRAVVVVAPQLEVPSLPPAAVAPDPVLVLWLTRALGEGARRMIEPSSAFVSDGEADVEALIAELSARIDAHRAAGLHSLGSCGTGGERDLVIDLEGDATDRVFKLRDNLDEELIGPCDAVAAAAGRREFADTLEMRFTPEERAVYEAYAARKISFRRRCAGLPRNSSRACCESGWTSTATSPGSR